MSLIFATQLTAIATAALAVFAIVTAAFAFLAYRAQAKEVGILLEQRKREALERHRAQATRVFIGAPHQTAAITPYVMNASDFPVYDVQLWYPDPHDRSNPGEPDNLGVILPREKIGRSEHYVGPYFGDSDYAVLQTVLTFRDAAGVRWIRARGADIEEQSGATAAESVLAILASLPADRQIR